MKKINWKNIKWKEIGKGTAFVVVNILIAMGVVAFLIWMLTLYLNKYTEHGIEEEVPDIHSLFPSEAKHMLRGQQLQLEVIDSTYSDAVPFGAIVEQDPTPGSHVKHGRTIYVTVNASGKRQVKMYNWRDKSERQVRNSLAGLGLIVDEEADYEPYTYRDIVLDVRDEEGNTIEPDQTIAVGTRVRLVVSFGLGTEEVTVPGLIGLRYEEASQVLRDQWLMVNAIYDEEERPEEEIPEEKQEEAVWYVYRQTPSEGETLMQGQEVKIYLSTDIEKAATFLDDEEENLF